MGVTVVLIGTLDTKGKEYAYLRDRLTAHGVDVVLVDAGIVGEPLAVPDITRDEVAAAGGADVAALAGAGDRGAAIEAMARGAAEVVAAPARRGPLAGDRRPGRLGQLVDRERRDARAAGRRAEADGVDHGLRRHAAVRRRQRRHDDVLGRRHRRAQPRLGAILGNAAQLRSPGWRRRRRAAARRAESPLVARDMFGVTTPA